jgi:hypothetical protein
MTRYSEKQLYKKFLDVVDNHPIARLEAEMMLDFKFYARFLAMFISKMKKDWVKIDEDFSGKRMKKAQNDYQNENIRR